MSTVMIVGNRATAGSTAVNTRRKKTDLTNKRKKRKKSKK
jgi:hypothetical protein